MELVMELVVELAVRCPGFQMVTGKMVIYWNLYCYLYEVLIFFKLVRTFKMTRK